jgi:chloramphenicol O-acetyltransferase
MSTNLQAHLHRNTSASEMAQVLRMKEYDSNVMKHDNAYPHNTLVKTSKKFFGANQSKSAAVLSPIRMNDTYRSTLQIGSQKKQRCAGKQTVNEPQIMAKGMVD